MKPPYGETMSGKLANFFSRNHISFSRNELFSYRIAAMFESGSKGDLVSVTSLTNQVKPISDEGNISATRNEVK
jgi:hypothetical protein